MSELRQYLTTRGPSWIRHLEFLGLPVTSENRQKSTKINQKQKGDDLPPKKSNFTIRKLIFVLLKHDCSHVFFFISLIFFKIRL